MPISKPICWGILGTGFAARKFADSLRLVPDTKLWAVGSRHLASAQEFACKFKVPVAYGSYRELANDPTINVVYVATPHVRHHEDCILCLKADKAVLCEKPFTLNAQQARLVIALARERHLFCMEAMWMRYMPLIQKVKQLVSSGEIGEVRLLTTDFGYPVRFDPTNRFFKLELGGGALLDRGIYPLSLAFLLLGTPTQMVSQAFIGKTGVDEQSAMVLNYENGALALLSSTLNTYASNLATIIGSRGKIVIHEPFYQPDRISITKFTETPSAFTSTPVNSSGLKQKLISYLKRNLFLKQLAFKLQNSTTTLLHLNEGNGFNYEALEAVRCLTRGDLESQIMPLDETLKIMEAMDTFRQQWNLKYPQE